MVREDYEEEIELLAKESRLCATLQHHLWGHTLMVVSYAKMLMGGKIDQQLYMDTLLACYFHDTGRFTDELEIEHGSRSAIIAESKIPILSPTCDLTSILFAIKNHSLKVAPNGSCPIICNFEIPEIVNPRIAEYLWDADRLDLYRILHIQSIDLRYLNTKQAKRFANSSQHVSLYEK